MGTKWKDAPDVADGFDAYDDIPERLIGYPTVFAEIGVGTPRVRTVLDYGCGPGKVAARVVEACDAEVVAVDISERMLDIARGRRPHPRVEYHQIDSAGLTFLDDESVDAAMSCYVFINVGDLDEIRAIAAEVHRVLRPGAKYAVLDTNPDTTGIRFSTFRNGEPDRFYAPGERREVLLYQPGGGVLELIDHHWPRQTYLDVFAEAGFTEISVREPLLDGTESILGAESDGLLPAEATRPPFIIVTGVK